MRRIGNIDPYVITDSTQARRQERMLPEVWDQRFPEQERRYLDPRELGAIESAPPEAQAAFEEAFQEEIRAGQVFFGLDPWLKRLCVWQKRQALDGSGEVVERALIFSDEFDPDDYLPADLAWENVDGRYDRYEGCVGAFFVPSLEDFIHLKSVSDHWLNSGKTLTCTRNWIMNRVVNKRLAAWRSAMNTQHDMFRDVYEYSFSWIYREAVRELGGGQGYNFLPQTSLDQLAKDMEDDGTSKKVRVPVYNDKGEFLYWEIKDRRVAAKEVLEILTESAEQLQERKRRATAARAQGVKHL